MTIILTNFALPATPDTASRSPGTFRQRYLPRPASPRTTARNSGAHASYTDASWRVDETYVKVAGQWAYLYRAIDKNGETIDFMLSPRRTAKSARRFLGKPTCALLAGSCRPGQRKQGDTVTPRVPADPARPIGIVSK